jgi:4-hydroxybenzoate polyprenyltransferase
MLTRIWHGRAYAAMAAFGFLLGNKYDLILPFAISTLLYISFAFAINNCFDVKTDSRGKKIKYNPLAGGMISFRDGIIFSIIIALIGIAVASSLPATAFVIYITSVFLALIYSAPPRLKTKPPLDLVSHGLFFGTLPFLFGLYASNGAVLTHIPVLFSLFFYSCFLELRNHIEDYENDLMTDTVTSAVRFGKEKAERIKWVFYTFHVTCFIPYLFYSPLMFFGILKERFADILTVAVYTSVILRWIL